MRLFWNFISQLVDIDSKKQIDMKTFDDIYDNLSQYKLDLQQFELLTDSQELWLGIVIDSRRILFDLLEERDINNRKDWDRKSVV